MKVTIPSLLGALLLCVAGCAVGPNYHPPETRAAPRFAEGAPTNYAAAPVTLAWWREFNDSLLNQIIVQSLASNQDLAIATARVREARALRSQAVADALPEPGAYAGYNKSLSSKDSIPFQLTRQQRELQLFSVGFDATWELDIFGHVRRSIQASTAELAATIADREYVEVTLVGEVARNYFELRGEQYQLRVAQQNAQNQRETLELTEALFKAGRSTELDTSRALAQLKITLAAVPPLEAAIKHSIHRLGVLTGQPPAALEPELGQPQPLPSLPPLVNIGDPAALLRRRPDVRAAERSLAAATARIGVETSALFPRVVFNGNIGFSASHLATLGASGNDTYSFGPQITWAALDLGHVRARIRAAHAQAEGQLANYEKTVLLALEETENALVDFGREQARRDLLDQAAQAATQAMTLARQRYDSGVADFLPVLDAERTQLDTQAQLAQSQTRTATSLVALYKALAGGWDTPAGFGVNTPQEPPSSPGGK
ncbi:MAG TPA: efflux transporter outer membrane subunit [Verrucomicrobiae bacterium]|nr:efflux transporter outer membrane subunit [Verrucomicrobiae bacterium]